MELITLLVFVVFIAVYILLSIFGSHECFEDTFVETLHYALTDGLVEGVGWLVAKICGEQGVDCLVCTEKVCCERSNPLGQLIYLTLLGVEYYGFNTYIFPLFPTSGVSTMHMYTGSAVTALTLASFCLVSFTDPGIITHENVQQHMALYQPDGLLFKQESVCETCLLPKPARSKHCRVWKRCIAKTDHYCIWVNTTIGYNNTRWFLLFLFMTSIVCFYGAIVGALTIEGNMQYNGAWAQTFVQQKTGNMIRLEDSSSYVLAYISTRYAFGFAATLFAGVAGWIVLGFTALTVYRVVIGETTNESYKRKLLKMDYTFKQRQRQASSTSSRAGSSKSAVDSYMAALESNTYNKGAWNNLKEVLFPEYYLRKSLTARKND